jgi:hypothetical protein
LAEETAPVAFSRRTLPLTEKLGWRARKLAAGFIDDA